LPQKRKCKTAASKLFTFREAGMQVSPVTMSHPSLNCCSTLFTTGYKRLTEGGCQAFLLGRFAFALRLLLFGFLMGKAFDLRLLGFWAFWFFGVGGF
jgi:hypothetical protein